jgi:hypothetical protein
MFGTLQDGHQRLGALSFPILQHITTTRISVSRLLAPLVVRVVCQAEWRVVSIDRSISWHIADLEEMAFVGNDDLKVALGQLLGSLCSQVV